MENLVKRPQLGFLEAQRLGWSRLTILGGRSRRSEFWWFFLIYYLANAIVTGIVEVAAPLWASTVVSQIITAFAFSITVRRLHDTGKSAWWVVVSWAANAIYSFYAVGSGILAATTAINASPSDILKLFTDPVLAICLVVYSATGIAIFIFCLLDSKPEANKYGKSPKYASSEEDFGEVI